MDNELNNKSHKILILILFIHHFLITCHKILQMHHDHYCELERHFQLCLCHCYLHSNDFFRLLEFCCVLFFWIVLPLLYLNPFGFSFFFVLNFVGHSELIAMENPFYRDNRQCMQIMENHNNKNAVAYKENENDVFIQFGIFFMSVLGFTFVSAYSVLINFLWDGEAEKIHAK